MSSLLTVKLATETRSFAGLDQARDYVRELFEVHGRAERAYRDSRMRLGRVLIQLKAQVRHGEWQTFVGTLGVNLRTAQAVMLRSEAFTHEDGTPNYLALAQLQAEYRQASVPQRIRDQRLVDTPAEALSLRQIDGLCDGLKAAKAQRAAPLSDDEAKRHRAAVLNPASIPLVPDEFDPENMETGFVDEHGGFTPCDSPQAAASGASAISEASTPGPAIEATTAPSRRIPDSPITGPQIPLSRMYQQAAAERRRLHDRDSFAIESLSADQAERYAAALGNVNRLLDEFGVPNAQITEV
ncbi:MAG: hypothetical protein IT435_15915 [Phycisphaerales bacterium]|nr:hypothetical protein [Phycisphaerales bacterium]